MFGRKKAKVTKKEVKAQPKKVEAKKVQPKEAVPATAGLSGRELNRVLRGKQVKKQHARGRV